MSNCSSKIPLAHQRVSTRIPTVIFRINWSLSTLIAGVCPTPTIGRNVQWCLWYPLIMSWTPCIIRKSWSNHISKDFHNMPIRLVYDIYYPHNILYHLFYHVGPHLVHQISNLLIMQIIWLRYSFSFDLSHTDPHFFHPKIRPQSSRRDSLTWWRHRGISSAVAPWRSGTWQARVAEKSQRMVV